MSSERQNTVLFADVSGSSRLYESAGDAVAHAAIAGCLDALRATVNEAGGRVIKTIGDEVMALFASVDAAAGAAASMHGAMAVRPAVNEVQLGVRIGLHAGPVIQRDGDVFGDTVNIAARLVGLAQKEQIITSAETAAQLGGLFRAWTRRLYSISVKGRAGEIELFELVWRADGDRTAVMSAHAAPAPRPRGPITLRYGGRELVRRRENDAAVLGRDNGCDLAVSSPMASRQHCTIERRSDNWVLRDHSTNGTYVTVEGDSEVLLRRDDLALRKRGWISFGRPILAAGKPGEDPDAVEYVCG